MECLYSRNEIDVDAYATIGQPTTTTTLAWFFGLANSL